MSLTPSTTSGTSSRTHSSRSTEPVVSRHPLLEVHHILQNGQNQRKPSASSASSSRSGVTMKRSKDNHYSRPKADSDASRATQASSSFQPEHIGQGKVRSLPPWLDSFDETDDINFAAKATTRLLAPPTRAHAADHHYAPVQHERRVSSDGYVDEADDLSHGPAQKTETGFFGLHKEPVKGRKWDHAREAEPVIVQAISTNPSPWSTFIRSSMYGPALGEDSQIVNSEILQAQTPGYEKPWRGDVESNDGPNTISGLIHSKKRRRSFIQRVQNLLLNHPLVPLIFRLTVLMTSIIALGLSASVHHLSNNYTYRQSPSATMAIAVDVVAIPYILYITWDEYTGKPLGLRSPKAKIRLVLLDLFFIIFESANLALAFGALTDNQGSCKSTLTSGYNYIICNRVKAMCGILFVALVAWSVTFALSIFRLVEQVGGKEEMD